MASFFGKIGKAFKKVARPLGKIAAGAGTGFLMGGPLGALAGGVMGGMQKGGLNFRTALKAGGMGALGGLGTSALLGAGGLSGVPGLGMLSGGGVGSSLFGGGIAGAGQGAGGVFSSLMGGGGTGGGTGGGGFLSSMMGNVLGGGRNGGVLGGINPLQLAGMLTGIPGARQESRRTSQIQDVQMGLLGQGKELAGISPEARARMLAQAKEGIRASQAERGIYESGVSAAQESELMPMIEQRIREQQLQQILGITGGYSNLYGGG